MKLKLRAGRYLVPVNLTESGDRWELQFPYNKVLLAEVKDMEGARWHGYDDVNPRKVWSVKKSVRNVFQLSYLMGNNPYENYDKKYDFETEWAKVNTYGRPIYDHQKEMIVHGLTRKRCIFAAEMGTGKTLAAIIIAENLAFSSNWYVGPVAGVRAVNRELVKWKSRVCFRMFTYEKLVKELENWEPGTPAPELVIFDESSRIKTPAAQRSKAALHLANAMREEHKDPYIILMSGTPAPKAPTDWWHQAEVACPGFLKEGNVVKFRNNLAIMEKPDLEAGVMYPKLIGWKQDEVTRLYKRLKGLVLVKFKKDCLDLPEKIFEEIDLPIEPRTLKIAKLIKLKETRAVTILMKLRELSDGFQYHDGSDKPAPYKTPKDQALEEYLELQEEEGRITVWAGFTASLDKCCDIAVRNGWMVLRVDGRGYHVLGHNVWDDVDSDTLLAAMDRSDPKYDELLVKYPRVAFIGHPKSGGMGLTLTASSLELFYSNVFDGEARMQAVDRGHRPGMTKALRIVDLIHLPTDRMILENLRTKKTLQNVTMGELSKWI